MRGYLTAEDRFLHMGMDHHLFVTKIETVENEFRFEVTRVKPGGNAPETVFEKMVNFSAALVHRPDTPLDQLIARELDAVRETVLGDETLHAHDP